MTPTASQKESFEDFKNSFFYGSRSDMNFKFLEHLPDEQATEFFQKLLWKLGHSSDDGNFGRIYEHILDSQIDGYKEEKGYEYDQGPFTPLKKPVSEARIVLLTSGGHFVEGQDPEPLGVINMSQQEAEKRVFEFLKTEPTLSVIPTDTPGSKLRVRHGGYDIRGAQADANVVFPLDRFQELDKEGIIGELAPDAYSFIGACSQIRLLKKTAPEWVKMLKEKQPDAILLAPV